MSLSFLLLSFWDKVVASPIGAPGLTAQSSDQWDPKIPTWPSSDSRDSPPLCPEATGWVFQVISLSASFER